MTGKLILDISHEEACLLSLSLRNHSATLRGGWNNPIKDSSVEHRMLQLSSKIDMLNESRHSDVCNLHWCNEMNKILTKEYAKFVDNDSNF